MMCSGSSRAVIQLEGITGTCQLIICGYGDAWTSVQAKKKQNKWSNFCGFVCGKYADDIKT